MELVLVPAPFATPGIDLVDQNAQAQLPTGSPRETSVFDTLAISLSKIPQVNSMSLVT